LGNFRNSPLSKVLNNKTNLAEILLVAFVIALGTSIIASSIVSLSFFDAKIFIWVGILIVALAFIYLTIRMLSNSEYNKKIKANIIFDKKKDEVVKIKNYDYSEKVYDYLTYAFNEDENIKAVWDRNTLNTDENHNEKSKSMKLIEEVTEYNLLDKVSEHLNTYFNSQYIGEDNITIIDRNDISDIITSNNFLDLFSKPMDERSAFLNDEQSLRKEKRVVQASSQKSLYSKFELKVPKDSELIREKDESITIKNKLFTLNFKVDFTGIPSAEIPSDYLKTFHQLGANEYNQYDIDITIKIKFNKSTFISNKGWEYYNWLDSLINKIEEDFCPIKFKEEINWKSNQLILDYLQNQMKHSLNSTKPIKNNKTYLFYANYEAKGDIWTNEKFNSYAEFLLKSEKAKLAINELLNQAEQDNLENIDALGIYYKGNGLESVSRLKLESFALKSDNSVEFDFINLEKTSITAKEISKVIDKEFGYNYDRENQFIVCYEENIDELLERSQKETVS